jgi:hypothetical protein
VVPSLLADEDLLEALEDGDPVNFEYPDFERHPDAILGHQFQMCSASHADPTKYG